GEIDIVVKAKGVIKTSEKVTRITNKVLGEVESVHYTDGQKVKQGDILYSLKKDGLDERRKLIADELRKAKSEYDELINMKENIITTNAGHENREQPIDVKDALQAEHTTPMKFSIHMAQLNNKISQVHSKLEQVKLLQKSMMTGKNYFTKK
ncbi:biotin/lipoyl-binding protein, partial [Paenibacillus popilliae]|uniref:biotin/lipoyl-binding protein n=1 Tax=Paenibacillus popilliae TaxID=78057 RepID=UPI0005A67EF0